MPNLNPKKTALLILVATAVMIYASEPLFSVIDDEVAMVASAVTPAGQIVRDAARGHHHPHPPLHTVLVHYWLRLTDGQLDLLRVPAILIFVAGLWFCCAAAVQIAGERAWIPAALVCALWPFGFHLGRVQGWYGLSFLFTALLTYAYLRCVKAPNLRNWLLLLISGTLLIYTNYYGWVLIGCLSMHFAWLHRAKRMWLWAAGTVTLWLLVFAPILPGFLYVLQITTPASPPSFMGRSFLLVYNGYALFAGESIAPWYLPLGVPVGLAVAGVVILTFRHSPPMARFLFAAMLALILMMTVQGLITTKRTMTLGPWLVIPVSVALAASQGLRTGRMLTACCGLIVLLAAYGVARPHYYAALRYVEPWRAVAQQEAQHARAGTLLLVGNPSFCFYLTHELQLPAANPHWKFAGVAPWSFSHPYVMDAAQWESAGRPAHASVRLIKGAMADPLYEPTLRAEQWLDQNCKLNEVQQLAEDRGHEWKQRFYPTSHQMRFRVELRAYQCQ